MSHCTATFVMGDVWTTPAGFESVQVWAIGDDGLVRIVTEYISPLGTEVGNVKAPFDERIRLSPTLSCRIIVSPGVSPASWPPIGCSVPPRSTGNLHPIRIKHPARTSRRGFV